MSIVRVGLAETRNFAEGYDAIFGKKKAANAAAPKPGKNSAAKGPKAVVGKKKKKSAKKK